MSNLPQMAAKPSLPAASPKPSVTAAKFLVTVISLGLTQAACANIDTPAEEVTVIGSLNSSVGFNTLVPVKMIGAGQLQQQAVGGVSKATMDIPLVITKKPEAPMTAPTVMTQAAPVPTPVTTAPPANTAEPCGLNLLTSLQMKPMNGGMMLAPVTIENVPKLMLVDTGGVISQLWESTVKKLNLSEHDGGGMDLIDVDGNISNKSVRVSQFALGTLRDKDIDFQIFPNADIDLGDDQIAGLLAPNMLMAYDVDFDYGTNKLNYFSQDHCEGKIQYWPAKTVTVIPFTMQSGHITIPVTIDGHKLTAIIDTGTGNTTVNMGIAQPVFGLTAESPDMTSLGHLPGDDNATVYQHTFANLSFGGVTVSSPSINLMPDMTGKNTASSVNLPQVIIGMDVLKHLHLYIAFKEKKIYISQASNPTANSM